MADAFHAAQAMARAARPLDYSISVILPPIPLWIDDQRRKVMNDLILGTMRLALQEIAGRVSDDAPRDTGHLAQSFGANPANAEGGIEILGQDAEAVQGINGRVFSSLPYAVVMDQGRRPGAPISRAGIDAIGLWAQRKLGLSAAEAAQAKWAIATSIIGQGIVGTGYFEHGVQSARPTVERLFEILGDRIVRDLTKGGGGTTGGGGGDT